MDPSSPARLRWPHRWAMHNPQPQQPLTLRDSTCPGDPNWHPSSQIFNQMAIFHSTLFPSSTPIHLKRHISGVTLNVTPSDPHRFRMTSLYTFTRWSHNSSQKMSHFYVHPFFNPFQTLPQWNMDFLSSVENDPAQVTLLPLEHNPSIDAKKIINIEQTHRAGSLKQFWTKTEHTKASARPVKSDHFFHQKMKKMKKRPPHTNAHKTVKNDF